MIDDSPSCEIIVYSCRVVQLGVGISSCLRIDRGRRKALLAFFADESVCLSLCLFCAPSHSFPFCLTIYYSCDMILSTCEYTRTYWSVYHVLLFATSSVVYGEGLSSSKEAYSLIFLKERKDTKRKNRERIGKRDIVVNNIDIEKNERAKEKERERKRLQLNTYASQFFSLSLLLSILFYLRVVYRKN